jgi:methylmalonyl-CoA mutase N-terminal domain/subunit
MREKYGARNPRSCWLRFHSQTAGCTLTARQPENNVARVAIQALAAVLGGTQSLHTNALDEVLALPSETAARIALRTQQIIAHETGVTNTVDPLGGSFYLERLTNQVEEEALAYLKKIDEMGGVIAGIESGYFVREIADAARRYQEQVDQRDRLIVGVNAFVDEGEPLPIPINTQSPTGEAAHMERLMHTRLDRGGGHVAGALDDLKHAAEGTENLMPYLLDAVEAYATIGEINAALRDVFGSYQGYQL